MNDSLSLKYYYRIYGFIWLSMSDWWPQAVTTHFFYNLLEPTMRNLFYSNFCVDIKGTGLELLAGKEFFFLNVNVQIIYLCIFK